MRKGFERLQSTWGLDKRIPLHDGSATSLPFEEHTFDAVFVAQVGLQLCNKAHWLFWIVNLVRPED